MGVCLYLLIEFILCLGDAEDGGVFGSEGGSGGLQSDGRVIFFRRLHFYFIIIE